MSSRAPAPAGLPAGGGYDPDCFARLAPVEDRHFWFRARARVITAVARRLARAWPPGYRVLEVGCGAGGTLRALERGCPGGRLIGMDLHREGLRLARRRCAATFVQADVLAPPFLGSFHLIGLFDVLEHLADDVGTLERLRELLRPEGRLLLTVRPIRRSGATSTSGRTTGDVTRAVSSSGS